MRFPRPPDRRGDPDDFRPILLANLLPLAGVLWLGWEPATLVFVYGLEILLSLVLAGGKALFAQRPPPTDRDGVVSVSDASLTAKRGSVRLSDSLPPIYPRNVPFALGVIGGLVLYGVFLVVVLSLTLESGSELTRPDVLLGIGALVGGQLLETRRQYFGRREYERVSPYAVVETPARQLFVLVFVLIPLAPALGSTGVLAVVICLKLLVEWSSFRASHDTGTESAANRFVARFVGWFAGPTESAAERDPVRAPETPPDERIRPARNALLVEGALLSIWTVAFFVPFFGTIWLFIVLAITAWSGSLLLFWLGVVASALLLVVALGIRIVTHYLEYGTLEYQRRGDYIVAYDRVLEEPQWASSIYRLRDVTVVGDRVTDRVLGTRTIRATTGIRSTETERRLGPVADPERLVEVFELPVATTDLEPVNRLIAAASGILAVAIVLSAGAFLVAPGVTMGARLDALVYVPFLMLVPAGLWKLACRSSE